MHREITHTVSQQRSVVFYLVLWSSTLDAVQNFIYCWVTVGETFIIVGISWYHEETRSGWLYHPLHNPAGIYPAPDTSAGLHIQCYWAGIISAHIIKLCQIQTMVQIPIFFWTQILPDVQWPMGRHVGWSRCLEHSEQSVSNLSREAISLKLRVDLSFIQGKWRLIGGVLFY